MIRKAQNSGHTVGIVSSAAMRDLLWRRLARIIHVAQQQIGKPRSPECSSNVARTSAGVASRCSRMVCSAS